MKRAFTLVELLIAVLILSILMTFLYKSYADLNRVNKSYKGEVNSLKKSQKIKQVFYLDLLLAHKSTLILDNKEEFNFISFMTKNSLHKRINPFVSYIVKDNILYRLESLQQIKSIDFSSDISFDIDKIGEVNRLKLFTTRDAKSDLYLLDLALKGQPKILFKIKMLN
jgi:prepilin-type N-terminal cleavage/methylation domain-containing protein